MYRDLGVSGLEAHTTPADDAITVQRVQTLLGPPGSSRILDLGCGYGRVAIPLALLGYDIAGIDASPEMLNEAKKRATAAGVDFGLQLADMCELPFGDSEFDVVLCMWLTYNELLNERDQLAALREMKRVLKPGGWGLIDGPPFMPEGNALEVNLERRHGTTDEAFQQVPLKDCEVGRRFAKLANASELERIELSVDDCPGRLRYFLRFWKD